MRYDRVFGFLLSNQTTMEYLIGKGMACVSMWAKGQHIEFVID